MTPRAFKLLLTLVGMIAILAISTVGWAQVWTCPAATGSTWATCATPVHDSAPAPKALGLYCPSGAAVGAAVDTCAVTQWIAYDNFQADSWILTTYAGWQKNRDVALRATCVSSLRFEEAYLSPVFKPIATLAPTATKFCTPTWTTPGAHTLRLVRIFSDATTDVAGAITLNVTDCAANPTANECVNPAPLCVAPAPNSPTNLQLLLAHR